MLTLASNNMARKRAFYRDFSVGQTALWLSLVEVLSLSCMQGIMKSLTIEKMRLELVRPITGL